MSHHQALTDTTMHQAARQPLFGQPHLAEHMRELLGRVRTVVAPVWPLKDYVAINSYAGVSERSFLQARAFLRIFSDCETLMPIEFFATQLRQGQLSWDDIDAAAEELQADGFTPPSPHAIGEALQAAPDLQPRRTTRRIYTLAEHLDHFSGSQWSELICNEISKHCAAHYDRGQAAWASPWAHLPLYAAWHSAAQLDRNLEILGLRGLRNFVAALPPSPEASLVHTLTLLGVPVAMWESVLLCQAFSVIGWSAWARHQTDQAANQGIQRDDLTGLLAMRMAYDAALGKTFDLRIDWNSYAESYRDLGEASAYPISENALIRYVLLRACEIRYRNAMNTQLQQGLAQAAQQGASKVPERKLAQLVFCIDVRSERLRRNFELLTEEIATFGFAGFFNMPINYVRLGEQNEPSAFRGDRQVPVLLNPAFELHEGFHDSAEHCETVAARSRQQVRSWRKAWYELGGSLVACFAFVETLSIYWCLQIFARALGRRAPARAARWDGINASARDKLGPTLRGLNHQGIATSRQIDLAETLLRNLGLTSGFARLVVLCGHTAETENNPLQASLDCGACGGHSGEANARFAALLLNQEYVRNGLSQRGIVIPSDTHFLAALHNTTTDAVGYFDLHEVPAGLAEDVNELLGYTATASQATASERLNDLGAKQRSDLLNRSRDWSQVRPEWGLAGNAAFIAAPRWMTKHMNLSGRCFLHSYDYERDDEGAVLRTIMTAPLIVAHWINMQYYASTVDQPRFGCGSKTIHNVVGQFGILSGSGGDLQIGLPWQSLHNGRDLQHLPLRLQAFVAAPRSAIEAVIESEENLQNLLSGGWLHLTAIENQSLYRWTPNGTWETLQQIDNDRCSATVTA